MVAVHGDNSGVSAVVKRSFESGPVHSRLRDLLRDNVIRARFSDKFFYFSILR